MPDSLPLMETNQMLHEALSEYGCSFGYCDVCDVPLYANTLQNYIQHIRGYNHRQKRDEAKQNEESYGDKVERLRDSNQIFLGNHEGEHISMDSNYCDVCDVRLRGSIKEYINHIVGRKHRQLRGCYGTMEANNIVEEECYVLHRDLNQFILQKNDLQNSLEQSETQLHSKEKEHQEAQSKLQETIRYLREKVRNLETYLHQSKEWKRDAEKWRGSFIQEQTQCELLRDQVRSMQKVCYDGRMFPTNAFLPQISDLEEKCDKLMLQKEALQRQAQMQSVKIETAGSTSLELRESRNALGRQEVKSEAKMQSLNKSLEEFAAQQNTHRVIIADLKNKIRVDESRHQNALHEVQKQKDTMKRDLGTTKRNLDKSRRKMEQYRFVILSLRRLAQDLPSARINLVEWEKGNSSDHYTLRSSTLHRHRELILNQLKFKDIAHNEYLIENNASRYRLKRLHQIQRFVEKNQVGNGDPWIAVNEFGYKSLMESVGIRRVVSCPHLRELEGQKEAFAKVDIPRGVILGQYVGNEMLKDEFHKIYNGTKEEKKHSTFMQGASLRIPDGQDIDIYVDGIAADESSPLLYINDGRQNIEIEETADDRRRMNTEFATVLCNGWPISLVSTTKRTKAGESLWIHYGLRYNLVLDANEFIDDQQKKMIWEVQKILRGVDLEEDRPLHVFDDEMEFESDTNTTTVSCTVRKKEVLKTEHTNSFHRKRGNELSTTNAVGTEECSVVPSFKPRRKKRRLNVTIPSRRDSLP